MTRLVLKLRKFNIVATMKPIVYTGQWVKKPTEDQVLEDILLSLAKHRSQFIISIEPAEEA